MGAASGLNGVGGGRGGEDDGGTARVARKIVHLRRNLMITCVQRLWPVRFHAEASQMLGAVLKDMERTWQYVTKCLRMMTDDQYWHWPDYIRLIEHTHNPTVHNPPETRRRSL